MANVTKSKKGMREPIEPHPGDKRYIRRDSSGRFIESDSATANISKGVQVHSRKVGKTGRKDSSATKH